MTAPPQTVKVVSSRRVDTAGAQPGKAQPETAIAVQTPAATTHVPLTRQLGNFGTGLVGLGKAVRAWSLATEYDPNIEAFEAAGDHTRAVLAKKEQLLEAEKRKAKVAKVRTRVLKWCWPVLGCGWAPFTLVFALIALVAGLLAKQKLLAAPKAEHAILMAATSGGLTALDVLAIVAWGDTSPRSLAYASRLYLLLPALLFAALAVAVVVLLGWVWVSARKDATVQDDLPGSSADYVPEVVENNGDPPVVEAVLATGRLKPGVSPALVVPGAVYLNQGTIWKATVDLGGRKGGPSARALVKPDARADLAAHLGLSESTMLAAVDKKRGSRLHIVGIEGDPWNIPRTPPLLAMQPVNTWYPLPFGPDVEGNITTFCIVGINSLFAGEPGRGKSTAMAAVWLAAALSPAVIKAIDGGEVDTNALRKTGRAARWTDDRNEAIEILEEDLAEIDRRQHLLAKYDLVEASPEWMDGEGLAHELLIVDELPTFTQDKSPAAKRFSDLLREDLQRDRKTGKSIMLGAQSPGVDVLDGDSRSIVAVRWCGAGRDPDLAAKALGKGTIGRGVDPRDLPMEDEFKGVGYYSTNAGDVAMRPFRYTPAERIAICARGVELLQSGRPAFTAADDDRILAARVAGVIRERGFTVTVGRVMLARDVAAVLEMDRMSLSSALGRLSPPIGTQKVSRPDDASAHGHMHYVLSDFPSSLAV